VVAIAQAIAVFISLSNGLGRVPEDVADVKLAGSVSFGCTLYRFSADVLQLVFSSRVLFLASHYFAKLSVLYLLRRLFARDEKNTALICDVSMGITALRGLSSVLLDTVHCSSQTIFVEHCHSQVSSNNICHFKSLLTTSSITRWSIITALDVTTEAFTLILPSYLVWQVQMRVETKLRVIAAFAFRLV
jgi:hypothetical protein